jgi:hypothetical protein
MTPTATITLTPTTVWFPATPTRTPLPTAVHIVTPTVDLSPRYGALILDNDFSVAQEWSLGRSQTGSIALGVNELTLAVSKERGYLYSLYQEHTFGDFYTEITASPSI